MSGSEKARGGGTPVRRAYEKPRVVPIELMSEEIMGGCKTSIIDNNGVHAGKRCATVSPLCYNAIHAS